MPQNVFSSVKAMRCRCILDGYPRVYFNFFQQWNPYAIYCRQR